MRRLFFARDVPTLEETSLTRRVSSFSHFPLRRLPRIALERQRGVDSTGWRKNRGSDNILEQFLFGNSSCLLAADLLTVTMPS